jgi:hypothetical protein
MTYETKNLTINSCQLRYPLKFRVFWDVLPCSKIDVDQRFGGACCLHRQGDESSLIPLMMEAARTSETSVDIYLTTRQYIPEGSKLHNRRRENLKSHRDIFCLLRITNLHHRGHKSQSLITLRQTITVHILIPYSKFILILFSHLFVSFASCLYFSGFSD